MNEDFTGKLFANDAPLKSILECDNVTDCAFIVDGKELKAHKVVLTYSSPVFEKMFYGRFASDRILITDIGYEDFSQMLKFIYTDSVRIKSVLHAWSLFYIAHKYLLNNLAKVCSSFIQKNLSINNLVLSYEFAEMYGNEELQTVCLNDIANYVRGIFQEQCDYHMKPSSILTILEQPILNISSNELMKNILHWAVIECDINKVSLTPENVINLLNSSKILQYLINLDFNVDTKSDDLISNCSQLIKNLRNPNTPFKRYLKKHWCIFCKCRQSYKIAGRLQLRERNVLISNISVNQSSLLYGLVLVAAEDDEKSETSSEKFYVSVKIQISLIGSPESTIETNFTDSMPYNETLIYVPLSDLFLLECDKVYTVKIQYTNPNNSTEFRKSSILCSYMSSQLIDAKKSTVFSFHELNGSVIRGVCYYPV